jgi:hypothetical protein
MRRGSLALVTLGRTIYPCWDGSMGRGLGNGANLAEGLAGGDIT